MAGNSAMPGCSSAFFSTLLGSLTTLRSFEEGGLGNSLLVFRGGLDLDGNEALAGFSISSPLRVRMLQLDCKRGRDSFRGLLSAGMLDIRSGIAGGTGV